MRLNGACDAGVEVLWLTRRLLDRIVVRLRARLEEMNPEWSDREAMEGFFHRMARSRQEPQAPVPAGDAGEGWLVVAVDVRVQDRAFLLTLRGGDDRSVSVVFSVDALRQWMGALYRTYRRAEWPLQAWPGWMAEEESPHPPAAMALH